MIQEDPNISYEALEGSWQKKKKEEQEEYEKQNREHAEQQERERERDRKRKGTQEELAEKRESAKRARAHCFAR